MSHQNRPRISGWAQTYACPTSPTSSAPKESPPQLWHSHVCMGWVIDDVNKVAYYTILFGHWVTVTDSLANGKCTPFFHHDKRTPTCATLPAFRQFLNSTLYWSSKTSVSSDGKSTSCMCLLVASAAHFSVL